MRVLAAAALFCASQAFAWNIHQDMVNRILADSEFGARDYLAIKIPVPCQEDEQKEIESLASKILIRAQSVPLISKKKCGSGKPDSISILELLKLGIIDEPDHGMDQDLPESADPEGYRNWMGGSTGPTSQGFRHMVFPGIEWASPLRTLQIPFRRIGAAPERIEILGEVSKEYFKTGNVLFGLRVLLWREHFIQDLLQPFHVTQVPDASMLPWRELLSGFVKQSTHAIANYHYAYEGLANEMVKVPDERGVQECFQGQATRVFDGWTSHLVLPRTKAPAVGSALYSIFGDYLKSKAVNLPEGIGQIDYYELLNARADALEEEDRKSLSSKDKGELKRNEQILAGLKMLRDHTCELMREAASLFRGDLDQNLQGLSTVSKTGK
jgi:hypothetical protein